MGLGTIFGLIGGILAISFKPDSINKSNQPITKICLQCGTVINNNKFCPECGKEVVHKDVAQNASYSIHEVTAEEEVENLIDTSKGSSFEQTTYDFEPNGKVNEEQNTSPPPKIPKLMNVKEHKPLNKKYAILAVAIIAIMIISIAFAAEISPLSLNNSNKTSNSDNSVTLHKNEIQVQAWTESDPNHLIDGYDHCHVKISYNPATATQTTVNITVKYTLTNTDQLYGGYSQNYTDTGLFILKSGNSTVDIKLTSSGSSSLSERMTVNKIIISNSLGSITWNMQLIDSNWVESPDTIPDQWHVQDASVIMKTSGETNQFYCTVRIS
jgi:hypothetical protein